MPGSKGPDLSVLDDALRELAKAQMGLGTAAITLVRLTNGDVLVSVMADAGDKTLPYARVERVSKRLARIATSSLTDS